MVLFTFTGVGLENHISLVTIFLMNLRSSPTITSADVLTQIKPDIALKHQHHSRVALSPHTLITTQLKYQRVMYNRCHPVLDGFSHGESVPFEEVYFSLFWPLT